MTLNYERYNAIKSLKRASMLIFERGKNRPSLAELRRIIRGALKHYIDDYHLDEIAKCPRCSKIIGKEK